VPRIGLRSEHPGEMVMHAGVGPTPDGSGFEAYVAARVFGATAATLHRAAVAWQLYELTGSKWQLGLLGLIQFAPTLALSLSAGVYADSHDRTRIVRVTQLIALAVGAGLALATFAGVVQPWMLYLAVLASASAGAFENPAGGAILPSLVPEASFARAVTWMTALRNVGRMSGPVLFGFLASQLGIGSAYALQAVLLAASLGALAFVRPRAQSLRPRGQTLEAVREGLVFLRGRPVLLASMTLDLVAVIFGGAVALLPVYASDILKVGPQGFGILAAALDVGTVAMGFLLVALPPIRRAGLALLGAVGGFGVCTIVFGLSEHFLLSFAALMGAGMADQVSMVARQLILQLSTPDALRGRVNAVNLLFIGASNELGAAESGFLAALTSAPFSVVAGGVICLAALAVAAVTAPSLRRYDTRA
jgi:MFS family permease